MQLHVERVLVGQKKAVAFAVRNASGRRRWSRLDEWLAGVKDGPERAGAVTAVDWRDDARITAGP